MHTIDFYKGFFTCILIQMEENGEYKKDLELTYEIEIKGDDLFLHGEYISDFNDKRDSDTNQIYSDNITESCYMVSPANELERLKLDFENLIEECYNDWYNNTKNKLI